MNMSDEGWLSYEDSRKTMTEIFSKFETGNYVYFSITTNGIACDPMSSTTYICIDMGYVFE